MVHKSRVPEKNINAEKKRETNQTGIALVRNKNERSEELIVDKVHGSGPFGPCNFR